MNSQISLAYTRSSLPLYGNFCLNISMRSINASLMNIIDTIVAASYLRELHNNMKLVNYCTSDNKPTIHKILEVTANKEVTQ